MEKFNKFEQENGANAWEISQEEFQHFSLEYLNEENHEASQEQAREVAEIRKDVERIFEKERGGERQEIRAGRESENFFSGAKEAQAEAEFFNGYSANFANYGGRSDFVVRNENRTRTAKSLSNEIAGVKAQVRNVDFSQKMANFGRAMFGRAA